jgi:hypothetical protein
MHKSYAWYYKQIKVFVGSKIWVLNFFSFIDLKIWDVTEDYQALTRGGSGWDWAIGEVIRGMADGFWSRWKGLLVTWGCLV